MREIYNQLAENYDLRQSSPATGILRKKEEMLIKKFANGRALDLGCGTGFHMGLTGNIGLDISEKMLGKAKSKGSLLIQGNMEALPIKSNSFDTVFCFHSTLNLVGLEKSPKEISRVLKQNGKLLLSAVSITDIDDHRSSPEAKIKKFRLEGKPINMRLFEKEEVVKAFEKVGMKMIRFDSVFRSQKPRWGNFQKYSLVEKLKIKTEKFFPRKIGRVYLFVFEKI